MDNNRELSGTDIPKAYDPKAIEAAIFMSWEQGGFFQQHPTAADFDAEAASEPAADPAAGTSIATGGAGNSDPSLDPYVITIPPPNVTGSLHMGHALNNTIQDVLIRKNRMAGRPTRWVVGTDHAGIATQNKVEQKLAKQGKTRFDIGREAFVDKCWEWRAEHGSQIINQLRAMGCSCDYGREWFTMDPSYQAAVREVFVDWFDQGLIYRGTRIINWCPRCTTALSDIEVEHEDRPGKLYHIRYPVERDADNNSASVCHITIATTRPETMLGDVAVAVHPDDARYSDLVGKNVTLPLVNRPIPIIADDYVDPDFGTGALKITPAHDANDFEVGQHHDLPQINIFDKKAVVTAEGGPYAGLTREEARLKIVEDLEAAGLLEKIDDHNHSVGTCYRCATAIEPWLSEQWFVDMKPLAAPAIDVVREGRVTFHPKRWENVYFHWMENIRDWCISRQLWWGHRIPVFYCDTCQWSAALRDDPADCPQCGAEVRQDEDVLDTWFSSQIWPQAVLRTSDGESVVSLPVLRTRPDITSAAGSPQDGDFWVSPELLYNYPTNTLSTAPDILFLWVARMIMSGLYFVGDIPFDDVIIHPTVFNKEGRRMSKSLGTGVDPLDLMEHYGADGMRFGLMLQVTGVQDMKFDEDKLLSSRNFANKIWNASRFVLMNTTEFSSCEPSLSSVHEGDTPRSSNSTQAKDSACIGSQPSPTALADRWILSRLAGLSQRVTDGIDNFEFGEVSRDLYQFFWSEFCDWYIELAKSRLNGSPQQRAEVQHVLVFVLDNALRLLHPMMPFLTEEIWRKLPRALFAEHSCNAATLIVAQWPQPAAFADLKDPDAERRIELLKAVVTALRSTRARYQISPRTSLDVTVKAADEQDAHLLEELREQISQLAAASSLEISTDATKPEHSAVTVAAGLEIFVHLEGLVDLAAEKARLTKEQQKIAAELAKFEKKLSNEGFLAKAAPEIIAKDRVKVAALQAALVKIESQLEG